MSAPIVVGFDPDGADDAPVRFGLAAARFTGAPLTIVAVADDGPAPNRLVDGEFREELSADARAALDRLRTRLEGEARIRAQLRLVEARSAARGLHVALEEERAGLAVVGATSRGAVGRAVIGSTADRVIHGAPCPVAVVPHGFAGGELRTVGVAFTRSPEGAQALRSGVALARVTGAALRVITVLREEIGVIARHREGARAAEQLPEEIAAQHRVAVAEALESALAEAGGGDINTETELVYGDPAEMLAGFTGSLDLLVMGSRAYGPPRSVLLGGVSRRVTATAQCPVVVLPRGAEHPLRDVLNRQRLA
jgi:nucleotide-binding universal stress UspA family protein